VRPARELSAVERLFPLQLQNVESSRAGHEFTDWTGVPVLAQISTASRLTDRPVAVALGEVSPCALQPVEVFEVIHPRSDAGESAQVGSELRLALMMYVPIAATTWKGSRRTRSETSSEVEALIPGPARSSIAMSHAV